ncbi:hypothetical protein IEQ11_01740 [Lysobacter capsici]|uniref:hypothetical protein n=1 Tax=Lysobacter capsici TaxID=435897 RepID=UPI00177B360F|nr:hypothetical protein [Lysobacter capsici]UOF15414.1 hypothetical protein IEQ11_01740 [Lysobacter capsici]
MNAVAHESMTRGIKRLCPGEPLANPRNNPRSPVNADHVFRTGADQLFPGPRLEQAAITWRVVRYSDRAGARRAMHVPVLNRDVALPRVRTRLHRTRRANRFASWRAGRRPPSMLSGRQGIDTRGHGRRREVAMWMNP